jgi:vacuolar-type H+-ATPase subunit I/STV1
MLEDERAKILEEVKSAKDERIHLLQRRITKLSAKLREMEEVLARAGSADEPDSGIASEYRGVQGLGAGSAHYEDKKNALEKLFECNLNLRKMSAGSV